MTKFVTPSQVAERMTDGCYVSGLYLEGAAWNVENQCLIRQPPKVLVQELPIMMIIPVELNKLKLHGTIRVPLYITQQRRNAMGKRECTAPCCSLPCFAPTDGLTSHRMCLKEWA